MVVECITGPAKAEKKPASIFFVGFLYSSAALFLSRIIFRNSESTVMVFFTVLAVTPLLYFVMKNEEKKLISSLSETSILKEHKKVIQLSLFLFLGFVASFALWYVVLPSNMTSSIYSDQIATISAVNNGATGNVISDIKAIGSIFLNNFRVLMFCILFSFLYGVGAIFILAWNASVIGAAIGDFIRIGIAKTASVIGFAHAAAYFKIVSLGVLRYSIHGIPEIAAYFIAGLVGSIISFAAINHDFTTKNFQKVIFDTAELVLISVAVLFMAAILEVYVTPILF